MTNNNEMVSGRNWPSELKQDGHLLEVNRACGTARVVRTPNVTKFTIVGSAGAFPAPPPKLHYSTWWRKVTTKLYEAAEKRRVDANRGLLLHRHRMT